MTSFSELPPDQVERLEAFRIGHPEVTITAPAGFGGVWSASRDGTVIAVERELSVLLDRLEWIGGFMP